MEKVIVALGTGLLEESYAAPEKVSVNDDPELMIGLTAKSILATCGSTYISITLDCMLIISLI